MGGWWREAREEELEESREDQLVTRDGQEEPGNTVSGLDTCSE